MFSFLLRCLQGPLQNAMVPYWQPPKLHFENMMVPLSPSLRFMLSTWLWDGREIATYTLSNFHNTTIVIRQIQMYLHYDVWTHTHMHTYIHTYTHTYIYTYHTYIHKYLHNIQTPLAFNMSVWDLLNLTPIMLAWLYMHSYSMYDLRVIVAVVVIYQPDIWTCNLLLQRFNDAVIRQEKYRNDTR